MYDMYGPDGPKREVAFSLFNGMRVRSLHLDKSSLEESRSIFSILSDFFEAS